MLYICLLCCQTGSTLIFSFFISGTKLIERFRDQFSPMLIDENMPWSSADSTFIRLPLSSKCKEDGSEFGLTRMTLIFNKFMEHASKLILFLKSILQVISVLNGKSKRLVHGDKYGKTILPHRGDSLKFWKLA